MHAVVEYNAALHDKQELPAADSLLEEKELLMLVQSLTPVYRMVFSLYVLEGLKHHEIAAKLDISEGTSKSNLSDARAVLQRKIIQQQKTVLP
jgi:RNA polymerase sigma-70 factor (ECF subfamily)